MNKLMKCFLLVVVLALGVLCLTGCSDGDVHPDDNSTTKSSQPDMAEGVEYRTSPVEDFFLAIGRNDIEEVKVIIRDGMDPDVREPWGTSGFTALMYAPTTRMKVVLMELGANPILGDNEGYTPLHQAVLSRDALELIPLMIKNGADVNAMPDPELGETPLVFAMQWFFGRDTLMGEKVVRLLAENGADLNVKGQYGMTPLIVAVQNGKDELAILLLELGADPSIKSVDGKKAITYAKEFGYVGIYDVLKEYPLKSTTE